MFGKCETFVGLSVPHATAYKLCRKGHCDRFSHCQVYKNKVATEVTVVKQTASAHRSRDVLLCPVRVILQLRMSGWWSALLGAEQGGRR